MSALFAYDPFTGFPVRMIRLQIHRIWHSIPYKFSILFEPIYRTAGTDLDDVSDVASAPFKLDILALINAFLFSPAVEGKQISAGILSPPYPRSDKSIALLSPFATYYAFYCSPVCLHFAQYLSLIFCIFFTEERLIHFSSTETSFPNFLFYFYLFFFSFV